MSEDKRLERIEQKVDKVIETQSAMQVTLGAQHVSLKDHIRRTNILEQELKPIKSHVEMVHGGIKLAIALSTLTGIALAILEYLKK